LLTISRQENVTKSAGLLAGGLRPRWAERGGPRYQRSAPSAQAWPPRLAPKINPHYAAEEAANLRSTVPRQGPSLSQRLCVAFGVSIRKRPFSFGSHSSPLLVPPQQAGPTISQIGIVTTPATSTESRSVRADFRQVREQTACQPDILVRTPRRAVEPSGLETRGVAMLSNDATQRGQSNFWAKFSISVSNRPRRDAEKPRHRAADRLRSHH
jgi:hypothetical protein